MCKFCEEFKGIKYCNGRTDNDNLKIEELVIFKNKDTNSYELLSLDAKVRIPINYCIMCGRKLNENDQQFDPYKTPVGMRLDIGLTD